MLARTGWLSVLVVLSVSCTADTSGPSPSGAGSGFAPDPVVTTDADFVIPPTIVVRDAGPTTIHHVVVPVGPGTYSVELQNGDGAGERRVSSARVMVNGQQVLGPNDFSASASSKASSFSRPFVATNSVALRVELTGRPSSQVHVAVRSGARVDASGAVLPLVDGGSLLIPANALSTPVTITATISEARPGFTDAISGTTFVEFGPDGLQFNEPVELRVGFDSSALPSAIDAADLALYRGSNGIWERVPSSSVDIAAGVVRGFITGFSTYGPLPEVVSYCTGGAGFSTLDSAEAAVAPRGTISVCAGEHPIFARIEKAVTIAGVHTDSTTLVRATSSTLFLRGGAPDGIVIRDLTVRTDAATSFSILTGATSAFSTLHIDRVHFVTTTPGASPLQLGGTTVVPGQRTEIRQSTFTGGQTAVFAVGGMRANVSRSTFIGQGFSSIQFQGGGGRVEDNHFEDCGSAACLQVIGSTSAPPITAEFVSNTIISPTPGRTTNSAIRASAVSGSTIRISGNSVTAVGAPTSPTDPATYAFQLGAIQVIANNLNPMEITGNQVNGGRSAIRVTGSAVATIVRDNHFANQYSPIAIGAPSLTLRSNDITGYQTPIFSITGALFQNDVRCNWWGSAGGPTNMAGNIPTSFFTPWATVPVAGSGQLTC